MIATHLPALQVIVPLILAPLCLLVGGRGAWLVALAGGWAAFAASVGLLLQALEAGTVSYAFGAWEPPWGIEYRVDLVNAFVLLVVSGVGAVVLPFARASVADEIEADRQGLFYTAWLLCLAGLLGITITGDAFNLFVFLEISSLASYVLIAFGRDRRALTASFQYLIMGTIGATFILIGVGLLYMMTGTLNMADIAARLPPVAGTGTVRAAFAFLVVGIGLKLAMFPLHLWLPNAYAYAPSAVTAFLAATATKVAVYVLVRFTFTVFGGLFSFKVMPLTEILTVLAVAAIVIASTVAVFQNDVKRMFAYSSVAQIGYMLIGIGLTSLTGLTGALLHLFNHALMKGALFLALGCVMFSVRSVRIERMAGIGQRMPWTMAAFVVGGLSLIGVPPTAGFISKWYLVLAAVERGWWPLVAVIVIGSLLAVVYVWRVVEVAYFREGDDTATVREAPAALLVPVWLLVAANVWFGIRTELSVGIAERAASLLLGASP